MRRSRKRRAEASVKKTEKGRRKSLLSKAFSRAKVYGSDPRALQRDAARMKKRIDRGFALVSVLVRLYNAFDEERIYTRR